jgi:hypothetical protein
MNSYSVVEKEYSEVSGLFGEMEVQFDFFYYKINQNITMSCNLKFSCLFE